MEFRYYSLMFLLIITAQLMATTTSFVPAGEVYTLDLCELIQPGACFQWEIVESPYDDNSEVIPDLESKDSCLISFTPEKAGDYLFQLNSFSNSCGSDRELLDQVLTQFRVIQSSEKGAVELHFFDGSNYYRGTLNYYCSDPGSYDMRFDQQLIDHRVEPSGGTIVVRSRDGVTRYSSDHMIPLYQKQGYALKLLHWNYMVDQKEGDDFDGELIQFKQEPVTQISITINDEEGDVNGVWSVDYGEGDFLSRLNPDTVPAGYPLIFTPVKQLHTLPGLIIKDGVESDRVYSYTKPAFQTVQWSGGAGLKIRFRGENIDGCPGGVTCFYEEVVDGSTSKIQLPRGDYTITYLNDLQILSSETRSLQEDITITPPATPEEETVTVLLHEGILRATFNDGNRIISTDQVMAVIPPGTYSILLETTGGIDQRDGVVITSGVTITSQTQQVTIQCLDPTGLPVEGFVKAGSRFFYCDFQGVTLSLPVSESNCH